jgi:hypothetical protein
VPPSPFDATVKGIPVFGTASLFAGRRSNEDLGRSVMLDAGLLPRREARRRQRMSEGRRGGERRRPAPQSSGNRCRWSSVCRSVTRPALGPSTRSRPPHGNIAGVSPDGEASAEASRSGKPAQAGGTGTGVIGDGRCAARRASRLSQGSNVARQKRKEVMALRPCEDRRARVGCSYVVRSCRSRQATSGLE